MEVKAELANAAVSDEVLTLQQRQADLDTIEKTLADTNTSLQGIHFSFSCSLLCM